MSVPPEPRRSHARLVGLMVAVVLLPTVPFLLFGDRMEGFLERTLEGMSAHPVKFSMAIIGAMAADLFLPVPSGPLTVLAGRVLGGFVGGAVSWIGLNLGALLGYVLARWLGPRMVPRDDGKLLEGWFARYGIWLLVFTRPAPLLAEACVFLAGAGGVRLWPFLATIALSNLGVAYVWALWGSSVQSHRATSFAIIASVVLPLAFALAGRWYLARNKVP